MRKVFVSLFMFIASFVLLTTVVYAWFTITSENSLQPISREVIKRQVDLDIEYGKNGGDYQSFDEPAEINAYLNSVTPGDLIDIRVTIENMNSIQDPDTILKIMLYNIRATETDIEYDLTDFFYLHDGTIQLTWYASESDRILENPYLVDDIQINRIDENEIIHLGVPLQDFRFSNIFDYEIIEEETVISNHVSILDSTPLPSGHVVVIEFSIGFDSYTPNKGIGIQDGELLIDGLYTLFDDPE